MKKYYKTNSQIFLLMIIGICSSVQLFAQTYTETFDGSSSTRVSSLNRTIGGVQFNFLFTTDGEGGDFVLFPQYGVSNSPSLDLRSFDFNTSTTERVSITRSDAQVFVFNSIFVRNDTGSPVTVQGFRSGSAVGPPATVALGEANLVSSGATVDQVQLTSTDFFNVNLDNFTWSVSSLPILLGSFSATLGQNNLTVNWTTLTETANDYFEVQVSADGKIFRSLGTVKSQAPGGNSDKPLKYQFEVGHAQTMALLGSATLLLLGLFAQHRRKVKFWTVVACVLLSGLAISCVKKDLYLAADNKQIYLRLAQIDIDGSKTYSKVIKASHR